MNVVRIITDYLQSKLCVVSHFQVILCNGLYMCTALYTISAHFSGNIINNILSNDLSNPKCSCVILEEVVNDSQAIGHPSYG